MPDSDQLRAHAERIRASGILGRSRLTLRLFDFLIECSLAGRAPKEIEVAIDVFGKDASFDVSQDAMVRVYIHKLRRKLEEFYEGPGAQEPQRLIIAKGSYRFALEDPQTAAALDPPPAPKPRARWVGPALAASLAINIILIGIAATLHWRTSGDELAQVRSSPVWSRIMNDDRTIFLVVGDYYIFGETDQSMEVKRLVREFNINSPAELQQYLMLHPELGDKYMDLQLEYLPTAAAFALRDVMPLLAPANRRIRVALASDLSPAILTSAHVIYVGYLSGMGMLRDLVFAGSRFGVGDSYDELVDHQSGHRYISQAALPSWSESKYHDYGYFATFTGPSGNQIVIVSGTRDVAVMHMAETVTHPRTLEPLVASAAGAPAFESLYEVYGMDRMNLAGKLLLTSRLNTSRIWTGETGVPTR
ncbi:MAG TPA: hypothetical protein VLW26_01450 [Steroidobacteraceae bacterium]|nr:hypothetical protein [Steroidobacteraceae bacterium]